MTTTNEVTQQAASVASTAKDKSGEIAQDALEHGRDVMDHAKESLREQARARTDEAGQGLRRLSGELSALAEGRADEAGPIVDYARRAASEVENLASRVEREGFDGILNDVADFGRRRPGMFLAIAGAAGFMTARVVRASRDQATTQRPSPGTPQESLYLEEY